MGALAEFAAPVGLGRLPMQLSRQAAWAEWQGSFGINRSSSLDPSRVWPVCRGLGGAFPGPLHPIIAQNAPLQSNQATRGEDRDILKSKVNWLMRSTWLRNFITLASRLSSLTTTQTGNAKDFRCYDVDFYSAHDRMQTANYAR